MLKGLKACGMTPDKIIKAIFFQISISSFLEKVAKWYHSFFLRSIYSFQLFEIPKICHIWLLSKPYDLLLNQSIFCLRTIAVCFTWFSVSKDRDIYGELGWIPNFNVKCSKNNNLRHPSNREYFDGPMNYHVTFNNSTMTNSEFFR